MKTLTVKRDNIVEILSGIESTDGFFILKELSEFLVAEKHIGIFDKNNKILAIINFDLIKYDLECANSILKSLNFNIVLKREEEFEFNDYEISLLKFLKYENYKIIKVNKAILSFSFSSDYIDHYRNRSVLCSHSFLQLEENKIYFIDSLLDNYKERKV